jgi:hypothetical protein
LIYRLWAISLILGYKSTVDLQAMGHFTHLRVQVMLINEDRTVTM